MPKYINSRYLSGADFVVRDNGRIFKRTGTFVKRSVAEAARSSHQPNKSLVIRSHEIDQVLYNATCSGASLGEQTITPGSSLELDASNTDVQMRFTGTTPGDTGTLVLSTGPGQTCTVTLLVNNAGNLVFDSGGNGSGPHELTTYPSRFTYFDCLNNKFELVFARKGSFVTNLSRADIPRPPAHKPRPPLFNPGQPPNYIPPAPDAAPPGNALEPYPSAFSYTNGTPITVTYPDDWSDYNSACPVVSDSRLGITKAYVMNSFQEAYLLPKQHHFYNFCLTGVNAEEISKISVFSMLHGLKPGWYDNSSDMYHMHTVVSFLTDHTMVYSYGETQAANDTVVHIPATTGGSLIVPVVSGAHYIRNNLEPFPFTGMSTWNDFISAEPAGAHGDIKVVYYGYFPADATLGIHEDRVYWSIARTFSTPPWPGWTKYS